MTRTFIFLLVAAAIAGCSASTSPTSTGGTGSGGLVLIPHTIDFGSISNGQTKDTTIGLFNEGSDTVTIAGDGVSSLAVTDTNFSHPITLAPDDSRNIEVYFTPSGQNSKGTDSLHYRAGGSNYVAVLTLEANAGSATGGNGALLVVPSAIDFGSLPIGQWHDTTATLVNTGSAPITVIPSTVSSTEAQDTNFSQPITINGGTGVTIHLQFNPAQAGLRTAVDSIHYVAGSTLHSTAVTMTATGSAAASNSPRPGSTYTYAVDTNGVPQGDSTYTILSNSLSFQGKTNVIEILGQTGDTNYYHIESNGDVSIFFNFSALTQYVSIPASWLTIPFGSKQTQSTTLLNDPNGSITFSGVTVPGNITVTSTGSYSGPGNISAAGKAFATQKGSLAIDFNFQGSYQGFPVSGSQSTTITMWYAHTIGFYPKRQDVTTASNTIQPTPSTSTTNYLLTSYQVK